MLPHYLVKCLCSRNCHAQELSEANCRARFSHLSSCFISAAVLFNYWRNDIYIVSTQQSTVWPSIYEPAATKVTAKSLWTRSSTFTYSLMASVSKLKSVYIHSLKFSVTTVFVCSTQDFRQILNLSAGWCTRRVRQFNFLPVTLPNVKF